MKKIMAILAASAVALALMGCDLLAAKAGSGEAKGTKNNKTISVDATGTLATVPEGETGAGKEALYRRFIKELSGNERTAAIKSTITIPKADYVVSDGADENVVVGYVFDLNKSWDKTANKAKADKNDEKYRDFVLFGFSLKTRKAYIEHYSDVNFKDELDTSATTIGSGSDKNIWGNGGWSSQLVKDTDYREDDDNFYLDVEVKQETAKVYDFYLGGKKRGSYTASGNFMGKEEDGTDGLAVGGIAGYLKCPKGTKAKMIIETDKKDVVGVLSAE
jgi:hypothetical protein